MENQTNLFKKSQKERLFEYIQQKKWCRTSEVLKWGVENFCNTPDRLARRLGKEGKIHRMPQDEKEFRIGLIKEDVWIV